MAYLSIPMYRDRVTARGHQAVRALHPTTFELTKDSYLTERGDCIIGVDLDKGVSELNPDLKNALRKSTSLVVLILRVGGITDIVLAQGHENLILGSDRKIVVRRSSYVDPATLAINANKGSRNLRRDLIEKLKNRDSILVLDIYVLDLGSILVTQLT